MRHRTSRDDFYIEEMRSQFDDNYDRVSIEDAPEVATSFHEAYARHDDIRHENHPAGLITGVRSYRLSLANPYQEIVKIFNRKEENILSFPIKNNGNGRIASMKFLDPKTLILLIAHQSTASSLLNFFSPQYFFKLEVWKISRDAANKYIHTFLTQSNPIYNYNDTFPSFYPDPNLLQIENSKITVTQNNASHTWEYDNKYKALKEVNHEPEPKPFLPCTIL